MVNPLFNQFNNQNNGILNLVNQIQDFQRIFKGDPKQEVEKLLSTGQMSQQQFNQFAQIANQLKPFLPNK